MIYLSVFVLGALALGLFAYDDDDYGLHSKHHHLTKGPKPEDALRRKLK